MYKRDLAVTISHLYFFSGADYNDSSTDDLREFAGQVNM